MWWEYEKWENARFTFFEDEGVCPTTCHGTDFIEKVSDINTDLILAWVYDSLIYI